MMQLRSYQAQESSKDMFILALHTFVINQIMICLLPQNTICIVTVNKSLECLDNSSFSHWNIFVLHFLHVGLNLES